MPGGTGDAAGGGGGIWIETFDVPLQFLFSSRSMVTAIVYVKHREYFVLRFGLRRLLVYKMGLGMQNRLGDQVGGGEGDYRR